MLTFSIGQQSNIIDSAHINKSSKANSTRSSNVTCSRNTYRTVSLIKQIEGRIVR